MLHVVGLPHTRANKDYNICAYTQKLRKFQKMFPDATYYFNEGSDGKFVQIFSMAEQDKFFEKEDWYKKGEFYKVSFDLTLPYWSVFNKRVIAAIAERINPGDMILFIDGWTQEEIAKAFPNNISIEFGVGYEGIFTKYRVFESYAWMHAVYGWKYGASNANGQFFDSVIPNYFDLDEFPEIVDGPKEDYLLFMSRPTERKGIEIVRELAKKGHKIKIAGMEKVEGKNIEWVGYANSAKRFELMSKAKAILCPTIYLEPFGGVVVEAALCGTPSITTDWGAFVETVDHGKTGYRCRTLKDFIKAIEKLPELKSPQEIRQHALQWSLEAVKPRYEDYFAKVNTLYGKGWYDIT